MYVERKRKANSLKEQALNSSHLKFKMGGFEFYEKFDMDLFFSIDQEMVVFEGKKIIVSLLDGTEIEVVMD